MTILLNRVEMVCVCVGMEGGGVLKRTGEKEGKKGRVEGAAPPEGSLSEHNS